MINNQELLKEISEQQLLELSDINATGQINQDVIDDALNDSISFIESFIILPNNPTPLLKKITVDLTIFELKRKNGFLTDTDKENKKENESYLSKMSNGRLKTEIVNNQTASAITENKTIVVRRRSNRRVNTKGFR